jgi:hypothetical protein
MASNKTASGFWIASAALVPFVLVTCLVWMYYSDRVQTRRAEAARLVGQIEQQHEQFGRMVGAMTAVARASGLVEGDPLAGRDHTIGQVTAPRGVVREMDRNLPPEKHNPSLKAYLAAESRVYGVSAAGSAGYVHEYLAARGWLDTLRERADAYLSFKKTQLYTMPQDGNAAALRRPIEERGGVWLPPQAALRPSRDPAADPTMRPPTRVTMELVWRRQLLLLDELVSANHSRYGLLVSGVAGPATATMADGGATTIGFSGEKNRGEQGSKAANSLREAVRNLSRDTLGRLDRISQAIRGAAVSISSSGSELEQAALVGEAQASILQSDFESQRSAHEADADRFRSMIELLPRLKAPTRLDLSEPDGEVSYSDFTRGVCHINLGHADGVRPGQRFEVWRVHGRETDRLIGVIEIVRTLSPAFSLCAVLSLTDASDPVRSNDKLISHIWHKGRFLTIALHGTFEPPTQTYTAARLKELLEQQGCRVVDRVQPGVDLVILGSNLLADEWYREARNHLRFDTLREAEVRVYLDPR